MGKNKGKKKQTAEEPKPTQGSGVPQDPQPSTSAAQGGDNKLGPHRPATTAQPQPEESVSSGHKGGAWGRPGQPTAVPSDTSAQPGFQRREQQSGRGWEKPAGSHLQKESDVGRSYEGKSDGSFKKPFDHQQRGDRSQGQHQQWRNEGSQAQSTGQQQGQDRGYQEGQGRGYQGGQGRGYQGGRGGGYQGGRGGGYQGGQGRGYQGGQGKGYQGGQGREYQRGQSREYQQEHVRVEEQRQDEGQKSWGKRGGQGQGEGQQWKGRSEQERSGGQQKGESGPTERQYQPRRDQQEYSRREQQGPPKDWQTKQTSGRGDSKKVAEGAPDKVQTPPTRSLATPGQPKSKSSLPREPVTALVPVYKEPGTMAKRVIRVQSNHFPLDLGNLKEAYQYDVTITEFIQKKTQPEKQPEKSQVKEKESKARRVKDKIQYKVMNKFLRKYFPDRFPSFDGKKFLYASRPLTENLNQPLIDTDITVVDEFERKKTFSIEIKYAKTLDLVPQTKAGSFHPPMLAQDAIQCIDIVLRNAPILCFNQIGASFFSKPKDTIINLGGGMEMYYGFYQSVVMGGRPLLNVHLAHKAFPKNMPVLDAFVEILNPRGGDKFTIRDLSALNPYQRKSLNNYIKSLKVAYTIENKKVIYRVNELDKSPKEATLNGTKTTVLEYFRTEKKYNIQYPDIPLLWVGSKTGEKRILIPPELCVIEKDQSVKRKMDDFQTTNMLSVAATTTHNHKDNTMKRFREAKYNTSPCVQEFGISISDKFETMDARILPTPELQYAGRKEFVNKGTWRGNKFLTAQTISKWAIVDISNDRYVNDRVIDTFVKEIKSAAKSCGVNIISDPDFETLRGRNKFGPTQAEVTAYFQNQKPKNYNIIFVIIPSSEYGTTVYSYVKGAAELTASCLTQCITARTISRFNGMTAMNILLKVNGKLDGVNHTFVTKPMLLQNRPVMIMGADVTHPGRNEGVPSVAAVIASHDPSAFQYNSCLRLQDSNMEYIVDLEAVVVEQLKFYYKRNNQAKPEHIIFFRDGVSEGQFAEVLNSEIQAIKNAFKVVQKEGYDPTITFLVVQKRHHTRLFPLDDRDSEDQDYTNRAGKLIKGNYNVPAGTCVDTTIVNPTQQNFYLVSHASIKGVSRPTKYVTLYDDLHLSNDEVQELAYYLCHMFARCNRSVSYPAPTYYAHLGALRGKAYIKPALDANTFNIEDLKKEMENIKIQTDLLKNNPMFFI